MIEFIKNIDPWVVAAVTAGIVVFYFLLFYEGNKKYDPDQACRNDCDAIKVRLAASTTEDHLKQMEGEIDEYFYRYSREASKRVLNECYCELRLLLSKMQTRIKDGTRTYAAH